MGINTPAPWVAFTRAGCDFAGVGSADMEFENDTSDIADVYGSSSSQYAFGNWSYNTAYDQDFNAGSDLGETDFEGLAIHCSLADSGPGGKCSTGNGGEPDSLPDEPGGYNGYNALFGAVNVDPLLTGQSDQPLPANYTPAGDTPPPAGNWQAPPVYDVFAPNATDTGRHAVSADNLDASTLPAPPASYHPGLTSTSQILDEDGQAGFPGFDGMEANNALGYTAAMQEAGVPVTYTYISDVHDDQYDANHGNAFGPGEAGHEAQLREYNAAFAAFFHRLAADGINKHNTLFLVTVDEGDHYDGSAPLNPGCNGVTVACEYDTAEAGGAAFGTPGYTRSVGEVDSSLPGLLKEPVRQRHDLRVRLRRRPGARCSEPDDPRRRDPSGPERPDRAHARAGHLERPGVQPDRRPRRPDHGQHGRRVRGDDPPHGQRGPESGADADAVRRSVVLLPELLRQGASSRPGCPIQNNGFAWNHGDIQPEIATTWQGWVGPGIRNLGETSGIWTDHTDARPTMMTVLGLRDDYDWDGAAIAQIIGSAHDGWDWWSRGQNALPWSIRLNERGYEDLAAAYKQLDAPFGEFGLGTLDADTAALATNSANDATYTDTTSQLQACENQRTALVSQIQPVIEAAETGRAPVSSWEASYLIGRADRLIDDAKLLAAASTPPRFTVCS